MVKRRKEFAVCILLGLPEIHYGRFCVLIIASSKYASISAWLPFQVDFLDAFVPSDWIILRQMNWDGENKFSATASILISLTSIAIHSIYKYLSTTRFENPALETTIMIKNYCYGRKSQDWPVSRACCRISSGRPTISFPSVPRSLQQFKTAFNFTSGLV